MILATETQLNTSSDQHLLQLPFGLIGLPKLTAFSLSPIENSWPFMSMKWLGEERMDFVVIDPSGLIPDYEIELGDEDADVLEIRSASDALVLNIVTVHSARPHFVTVNLVGPIVVNRHTCTGKQIIILNWSKYSSQHPLIDQRPRVNAA
jgi:flagellar assembly factor FliW